MTGSPDRGGLCSSRPARRPFSMLGCTTVVRPRRNASGNTVESGHRDLTWHVDPAGAQIVHRRQRQHVGRAHQCGDAGIGLQRHLGGRPARGRQVFVALHHGQRLADPGPLRSSRRRRRECAPAGRGNAASAPAPGQRPPAAGRRAASRDPAASSAARCRDAQVRQRIRRADAWRRGRRCRPGMCPARPWAGRRPPPADAAAAPPPGTGRRRTRSTRRNRRHRPRARPPTRRDTLRFGPIATNSRPWPASSHDSASPATKSSAAGSLNE